MKTFLLVFLLFTYFSVNAAPIQRVSGKGNLTLLKKLPEESYLQEGVWLGKEKIDKSKLYCEVKRRGARVGTMIPLDSIWTSFSTDQNNKRDVSVWIVAYNHDDAQPWLTCVKMNANVFDTDEIQVAVGEYFKLEFDFVVDEKPDPLRLSHELGGKNLIVQKEMLIRPEVRNLFCNGAFGEECEAQVFYTTLSRSGYTLKEHTFIRFGIYTLMTKNANGESHLTTQLTLWDSYDRIYVETDGEKEMTFEDFKNAVEPTLKITE